VKEYWPTAGAERCSPISHLLDANKKTGVRLA
jgi:hypothetical protein